jgi:hypothetical protein
MPLAPFARARLQASAACIGTLALWWWRGGPVAATLAGIMAALAVLAWAAPVRYAPVQRTLDRLIHWLLTAITWALLGLVYFLVFTPIRLVRSLAGRDPLARQPDPAATSYLKAPSAGPRRFDRQF